LDLFAHVAVAVFCGVGWLGAGVLVLAYFWFGRLARYIAVNHAMKDILRMLAEQEPHMRAEERSRLASTMLELRMQRFTK
jgi:hypothetical protein